jgi:hypothetical protein
VDGVINAHPGNPGFNIEGTLVAPILSPAGASIGLDADPSVFPIHDQLRERGIRLGINLKTGQEAEASRRVALEDSGLYGVSHSGNSVQ